MFPLNLLTKEQKYAIAQWVEKQAVAWYRNRNLNKTEAQRHSDAQNWREAEKHFLSALAERRHSTESTIKLNLGLAKAQRRLNKLHEAEQSTRSALDLAVKHGSRTLHGDCLDCLAEVHLDQGRYAEARKMAEENFRLEAAQLKPNKQRLGIYSSRIGTTLAKSGQMNDAAAEFKKAIAYCEKPMKMGEDLGVEHLEAANMCAELGMLYRSMGNHGEAQALLRKALKIHRQVSGVDSQAATLDLQHLAMSLEESGDLEGAAKEYERLLNLQERQVGIVPEQSADAEVRLATIYLKEGRTGPAQELLTHAIGVLERNPGPLMITALERFAELQDFLGRPDHARRARERAAGISQNQKKTAGVS
jgi:tetratricopeptide (TPR) repeat protein